MDSRLHFIDGAPSEDNQAEYLRSFLVALKTSQYSKVQRLSYDTRSADKSQLDSGLYDLDGGRRKVFNTLKSRSNAPAR